MPPETRMTINQPSARPRPRISPDNLPFWEGCQRSELMLPTCQDCGRPHLPPGPVCPFCFSDRIGWKPASGRGRISTWVVVHKAWFEAFRDDIPANPAEDSSGYSVQESTTPALSKTHPDVLALGKQGRESVGHVDSTFHWP